jgi:hypothetical protein
LPSPALAQAVEAGTAFDGFLSMRRAAFRSTGAILLALLVGVPPAAAYSVLAHEALIDLTWQDQLEPMLKRKFPRATTEALREARAYAYGGSLIQDLGYYPFGSRFFSNLVHYVRAGDFVETLIRESQDVNEYAFSLGALAHYASDTAGHSIGVNRAVPLVYPKLREKHGNEVLYAASPTRHVMVEFAFDVLQAGRGTFRSDLYQDLVGFKVAIPLLQRAFRSTYSLELTEIFANVDLAVGTYRRSVSKTIPDITRAAWRESRDEILEASPGLTEQDFVFTMTRQQYEDAYGTTYRKPGVLARFVVMMFKIIPKFGPFKPLAFEPLTPETERMFLESFEASRAKYRAALTALETGPVELSNADLDTGHRAVRGANQLADETHGELLERLVDRMPRAVPDELRHSIAEYFASPSSQQSSPAARTADRNAARNLAILNATTR